MLINKFVIVGGGSAGWMTAATLIKAFPDKKILVIEPKNFAIVGVGESTLGGIKNWTRFIGLNEKDFIKDTDASYKLSIKFTDFYKKDFGSFHYPFGFPTTINDKNPFTEWHYKKYFFPETPISDFVQCLFSSSVLFENNKFYPNFDNKLDNFNSTANVAYHFDATKFGIWLKEKICIPNGVICINDYVKHVETTDIGIDKLILSNDKEIKGDLYIDCTGFQSLLLEKTLKEPFISYSNILPNNTAWATKIPYKNRSIELEGFTNSTAIENGWCWNIPLWSRLGAGYVFSNEFITDEDALDEFKNYLNSNKMVIPRTKKEIDNYEYKKISMRIGIHKRTFVKNVVAIGLSAGFIEPLESNGLFSVHEFLFKLVDILQRNEINQFDRDMYNISVKDLFDNFSKFVSLHYALSHRDDTEYWKNIKNKNFQDNFGDPYFPYQGRSDAFYNMSWRYMDDWGHEYNLAGIPYIATGMNLFMMNRARIENIENRTGVNLKNDIISSIELWDKQKKKWNDVAKEFPSLEKYLNDNFYHELLEEKNNINHNQNLKSKFISLIKNKKL